ncbi:hypothetical protein SteCoe_4049 [Stentor coeruleus]|uniref:Cyclic nucleotide-binding domain-containing protein n=1 Tax=Stentor coeruleus TaxID=5963 RepID=A0A1R2CVU8_9CILI|nr:hypothetical protein SteCoe_4049 [Stentor coeruleus]
MENLDSKWLFSPKSTFKNIWNSMIMLLLSYTATILPYRMSFNALQGNNWVIVDVLIDSVFILDILITFNTALVSFSEKHIYSRKAIAKSYIKSWFLIDLISCIPLEIIDSNETVNESYNKFLRILKVSRIYRFVRVLRLLKLLRFLRSQYVKNLLISFQLNAGIGKIIIFFLSLGMSVHILGCLWFYVSSTDNMNLTWTSHNNIDSFSDMDQYIVSVYFVFTTLTTVGYGDNFPISNIEKIFTIILMCFGIAFYSLMIGSLASSIKSRDRIVANIKTKTKRLKEFAKATHLDNALFKKIKLIIKENTIKCLHERVDIDIVMKDLPSNLREEIYDHLYLKIVQNFNFFQDRPKSFVNALVPKLVMNYYIFQEILYEEGDLPEEIFLIKLGSVFMNVEMNLVFRVYKEGSYFGEIEILENKYRDCTTTIGSRTAELYTLSKNAFLTVLKDYPSVMNNLQKIAKDRDKKHEESKKDALFGVDHCKISHNDDDNKRSLLFHDDKASDSDSGQSLFDEFQLGKKDTGLLISIQNDNMFKRRNRRIWTKALGRPVRFYRNSRRKTTSRRKTEIKEKEPPTKIKKTMKMPQSTNIKCPLNNKEISPIIFYSDNDEDFKLEELGLEPIENDNILKFNWNCENILSGLKGRSNMIEENVLFI